MGVIRRNDIIILVAGLILIWGIFSLIMGNDFAPEHVIPQSLGLLAIFIVIWVVRYMKASR